MRDIGDAIATGFSSAVNQLITAIPNIIGFLAILIVGWILSGILGRVVTSILQRVGADRMFAQHGAQSYGQAAAKFTPSRAGGEVVKWLIRLIFIVAATNVLGLTQVSVLINQVLLWIPNLIVAAIILLVAPLLAKFVRGLIEVGAGQMGFSNASVLGRIAEIAIIAFAVIVAINQIGIAANLVNTLFIGFVAALAIAFGLAFGLGGRGVAEEITRNWYESSQAAAEKVKSKAQQQQSSTPPIGATPPPPPQPRVTDPGFGGTAPSGGTIRPR
jgi:hypothetical protein